MGVGDEGGGAPGQHLGGKQPRGDHRRLDVQVGVDKAGDYIAAGKIDLLLASILAHADDGVAADGDVAGQYLAGKDVEHPGVFEHQLGRHLALCGPHHLISDSFHAIYPSRKCFEIVNFVYYTLIATAFTTLFAPLPAKL